MTRTKIRAAYMTFVVAAAGIFASTGCTSSNREKSVLAEAVRIEKPERTNGTSNAAGGNYKHVVVMWLKTPGDAAGRKALLGTATTLRDIPGVVDVVAGECLPSDRKVVDSTYDVALMLSFSTEKALREYAGHPSHQKLLNEVIKPNVDHYTVYDFVAK
jgi:hypothetical protein